MSAAHELIAARARRVRLVRRRVAAAALAGFVLAWGLVAFDGSKRETTTVASTATATTPTAPAAGGTLTTRQS
jgi:hypothetical protein